MTTSQTIDEKANGAGTAAAAAARRTIAIYPDYATAERAEAEHLLGVMPGGR